MSGRARLLITGLGPVGLAAAMLGRALGAGPIIATDVAPERLEMAESMGLVDHAVPADARATATIQELTDGRGCEASIDCSGSAAARVVALENARTLGTVRLRRRGWPDLVRGVRAADPQGDRWCRRDIGVGQRRLRGA